MKYIVSKSVQIFLRGRIKIILIKLLGGPEHVEGNEHTSKEKLVENCKVQHISGYSSRMKEQI